MFYGGETIRKIGIIATLVLAMVAVPAIAQDVDLTSQGMYQTGDNAFKFPVGADTSFGSITVGNDYARAFGWSGFGPFWNGKANAQNDLEIMKNQNVGACASCCLANDSPSCGECSDACITVNIDNIKVGDMNAQAIGFASAENNIKILTSQDSY